MQDSKVFANDQSMQTSSLRRQNLPLQSHSTKRPADLPARTVKNSFFATLKGPDTSPEKLHKAVSDAALLKQHLTSFDIDALRTGRRGIEAQMSMTSPRKSYAKSSNNNNNIEAQMSMTSPRKSYTKSSNTNIDAQMSMTSPRKSYDKLSNNNHYTKEFLAAISPRKEPSQAFGNSSNKGTLRASIARDLNQQGNYLTKLQNEINDQSSNMRKPAQHSWISSSQTTSSKPLGSAIQRAKNAAAELMQKRGLSNNAHLSRRGSVSSDSSDWFILCIAALDWCSKRLVIRIIRTKDCICLCTYGGMHCFKTH